MSKLQIGIDMLRFAVHGSAWQLKGEKIVGQVGPVEVCVEWRADLDDWIATASRWGSECTEEDGGIAAAVNRAVRALEREPDVVARKLATHERWRWQAGMVGLIVDVSRASAAAVYPSHRIICEGAAHASVETATMSEDRAQTMGRHLVPQMSHPSTWGALVAMLIAEGAFLDLNSFFDAQDPDAESGDADFGAWLGMQLLERWGWP